MHTSPTADIKIIYISRIRNMLRPWFNLECMRTVLECTRKLVSVDTQLQRSAYTTTKSCTL